MKDDIVISIDGLTKRFGNARKKILAVHNLSVQVPQGSIYGFLGPNGSGKTTTIGMLLGLIRPSEGSIELFGEDLFHNGPELLKRTSSVLENSPMYPYLSGRDNLEVFGRMRGFADRRKMDEVLDIVGLTKRADSPAKTYSLGMRQRLSIALALLSDPELIILDEPTNGLDPSGIIDIRDIIKQLGDQGKTIFLSSHLLHEVEQVCNYVAVLDRGRVIAQGPVDELLHRGKTLALKVNDINAASSLLSQVEWISTIETDDEYLYVTADEEKHPDINEMLVQSGIRVFEMKKFSDSLEDFFLDVIEEDRRMAQMINLLKAELFKLRKRWMPYVLLLVLLTTVLLPIVINYINYNDILSNNPELANIEITVNPDGSTTISGLPPFEPDSRFDTTYMYAHQLARLKKNLVLPGAMESVFDSIPNLGMFLVIVLAASVIGNEYGWGTVRQAIGRGNSRASYLTSKVLTTTLIAVAGIIAVVVVGLIATIITSLLVEGSIAWEGFASYFFISLGVSLLVIMVYIALATFFAVLLRSAMAGMAVAVAWFIGESIVMALLIMSTGWLADLNVYLLSYNTGQLLSFTFGGDFTAVMWKSVGLIVLYSGIFLAGSYGVFRRTDCLIFDNDY